jgi:hypothetical protein
MRARSEVDTAYHNLQIYVLFTVHKTTMRHIPEYRIFKVTADRN